MTSAELTAFIKKNPLPVVCGFVALVIGVAIYFRSDAMADAATELEQASTEGRRLAANLSNAAQLQQQYDALKAATKTIESRLIRASDLGTNSQFFFKLESETGVKGDPHQGGRAPGKGGTFVPISFSVNVQGDFAGVMHYLNALENGPHYCRVISATCAGDRKGPVTLALNIQLLGFP